MVGGLAALVALKAFGLSGIAASELMVFKPALSVVES